MLLLLTGSITALLSVVNDDASPFERLFELTKDESFRSTEGACV
jgi:hypothetical protein